MEYIRIGLIAKAQGIKGELKIVVLSDDKDRFEGLEEIFIEKVDKSYEKTRILTSTRRGPEVFAFFEKIDDRTKAEKMRNCFVCVKKEDAITLEDGRYFIFDLVGCAVFDSQKNDLGVLKEVFSTGPTDVYLIRGKTKDQDFMVPALKSLLKEVDILNKKIILDKTVFDQTAVFQND